MDIKEIAEHLKALGLAEIKKLASILEADVETAIGITIAGKPAADDPAPPTCPDGYYWDAETQKCILNVGG